MLSFIRYSFLFLFSFGVGCFQLLAKTPTAQNQLKIYSLENAWSIYDNQLQAYVPFLPQLHTKEKQLYLILDHRKYKDFYLSLVAPKGTYLFLNNNLFHYFQDSLQLNLKIDSLQKITIGKPLLLTYLSMQYIKEPPSTKITIGMNGGSLVGNKETVAKLQESTPILIKARAADRQDNKNFLLLATMGLLTIMAVFSYISKPMFSFQILLNELGSFLKGKNQIKRLSTPSFLFFLLYYGLALSFAIMFLSTYSNKISYTNFFVGATTLEDRIEVFLLLTASVIALIVSKYGLIWVLGSLYNDRNIINLHFQEYMNISQLFCVVWLSVILLANSVATAISPVAIDLLVYFFGFCMLLQSILMSYRINNSVIHKKLYLFSYLCASEYLPLFLSAKLLMN